MASNITACSEFAPHPEPGPFLLGPQAFSGREVLDSWEDAIDVTAASSQSTSSSVEDVPTPVGVPIDLGGAESMDEEGNEIPMALAEIAAYNNTNNDANGRAERIEESQVSFSIGSNCQNVDALIEPDESHEVCVSNDPGADSDIDVIANPSVASFPGDPFTIDSSIGGGGSDRDDVREAMKKLVDDKERAEFQLDRLLKRIVVDQQNSSSSSSTGGANAAVLGYIDARKHDPSGNALDLVGLCYEYGVGVAKDERLAAQYYERALARGNNSDQCTKWLNYGMCFEHGIGVKKDVKKAFFYYQLNAGSRDDPHAAYKLAQCYEGGIGVAASERDAVRCYREAALRDHVRAQRRLGDCHLRGELGVPKLPSEAVKWYLLAAEKGGDDVSQYRLGQCYELGRGVERSRIEAVRWYLQAVDRRNADAIKALNRLIGGGI